MKKHTIISHSGCSDGFCSAWIADKALKVRGLAQHHFADYYTEPPWVLIDKETDVFILDFSYSRELTEEINRRAGVLTVLDHHATHQEALKGLPYATFDMNRSGAGMTWDFFHSNYRGDEPRPWLVNYVEDHDLWRKALPHTDAVNAYIKTVPFQFDNWDLLADMDLEEVTKLGLVIRQNVRQYLDTVKKTALMIDFEGYRVPCVNAQRPFVSELLNELAQGHPFAMSWHVTPAGWELSFRSDDNGVDVSEIAKLYGGGGHKKASGALLNGPLAHITQYKFK